MVKSLVLGAMLAAAAGALVASAQPPARRPNLTGTVVAVNQQSDSVTLIDLKTLEAYRHVPVVGGPHEAAASPDGGRWSSPTTTSRASGRKRRSA
jgi:YVTN family beta-propeller protein